MSTSKNPQIVILERMVTMRLASSFTPCFILMAASCHTLNPARFVLQRHFTPVRVFQSATEPEINGDDGAGRSGMVRVQDTKSQLFAAFTALGEEDQYDAVLTGLCAKFLETVAAPNPEYQTSLRDPLELLQEMNRRRIQASPRSVMALIDSAARTQSAQAMAEVLDLCRKNGAINSYGSLVPSVLALPPTPNSRARDVTRSDRLSKVAIPSDDRETETTAALAVASVLGSCVAIDVAHWNDLSVYTNVLIASLLVVGAIDNGYDMLSMVARMASKDSASSLPVKDELPFGLGSGKISGNVIRGLARLSTVDAERESQCEAAALMVAYQLGLPCFPFRPNALEGSILVINSSRNKYMESLRTPSGIVRLLVWLYAPVASENGKHSQLICSDPREADGLLRRLEEYYKDDLDNLPWETRDREELMKWAYAEADLLLRDNKRLLEDLSKCLTSGAGTIGDCVAVLEGW